MNFDCATVPDKSLQGQRAMHSPAPLRLNLLPAAFKILRCSAQAYLSGPAKLVASRAQQRVPVWMETSGT